MQKSAVAGMLIAFPKKGHCMNAILCKTLHPSTAYLLREVKHCWYPSQAIRYHVGGKSLHRLILLNLLLFVYSSLCGADAAFQIEQNLERDTLVISTRVTPCQASSSFLSISFDMKGWGDRAESLLNISPAITPAGLTDNLARVSWRIPRTNIEPWLALPGAQGAFFRVNSSAPIIDFPALPQYLETNLRDFAKRRPALP